MIQLCAQEITHNVSLEATGHAAKFAIEVV